MNGLSIIHNSINNLLEKFRFNDFKKPNLFYVISALAISTRLFNFNVDVSIDETRTVDGNINLLQDVFNGFKYLLFLPVVIFFANSLYDTKYSNKKNIFYVIYLILLLIFSFSFNNRSIFFDAILLSALIIFILFLFSKIKIDKFFVLKFFFFLFIIAPSLNFIENLSLRFIDERSLYSQRTPIENLESFVSDIFDKKKSIYSNKKKTYKQTFFIEEYYSKGIFNRINILIVHDNFIFLKSVLSKNQIQGVKDLQVGKIISVLPGPVIRVFIKDFEKSNFLQYSTASYLYGIYDVMYGNLNIGSALMTLYLIFNKWLYFMLLFLFIPTFIFFDSFFNKKLMIFSPFILIFFYSTSGGVLNFFAASDISIWFTLIFRSIPQTFLIVLILNYILQKIIKINE